MANYVCMYVCISEAIISFFQRTSDMYFKQTKNSRNGALTLEMFLHSSQKLVHGIFFNRTQYLRHVIAEKKSVLFSQIAE